MSHDPGQARQDAGVSSVCGNGLEALEPRLLLSASLYDAQELYEPADAAQAEVLAADSTDLVFGIDVSHWQGTINWNTVANNNDIDFVWAKATEGVDYIDDRWYANVTGAHAAGLYVGGYHFATPYTGGVNDAADEASDFYDAVSPYLGDGYARPALDLESGSSLSTTVLSNWVHDFMDAFSLLSGGIVPIIYTGRSYANDQLNSSVNTYDLWLAAPTGDVNTPIPSSPYPDPDGVWNGYDLWQYSWTESVAGISGDVDGDAFFGNLGEFVAKYVIDTTPDDHGDDVANATSISIPSTTSGLISNLSDSDWFEVNLTAGVEYSFSVLADGLTSAELRLRTNLGNELEFSSGPVSGGTLAQITYTPISSQVYYLSVDSSGAGGYNLAVQEADDHGDSIAESSELTSGLAIGGLQTGDDQDYFHFSATSGMLYSIDLMSLGLTDGVLTLYNSGGTIIDQQIGTDSANPMAQLEWTASADADMYVRVSSNLGSLGDYYIAISENDPAIVGDLDGDGFVGLSDLDIVLAAWNQSVPPADASADPSGDGFVGLDDLDIVLANWNAGTPPADDAVSSQQDEVLAAASGDYILGVDVSVYQGTINWPTVGTTDREFVVIRAIDRFGNLDTRFHQNITGAYNAGLQTSAYHFVSPWTDGYNDAVEEAQLFAGTLAPYITDGILTLRPAIDIEGYAGQLSPDPIDLNNTVLTNWVHDYMEEFVRLTGIEPMIYVNRSYANNAFTSSINQYELWLAAWTDDPDAPVPTSPYPDPDGVWNGFDFWQYSGGGDSVAGISGGVDGDVYFGSVAEMLADHGVTILPDDYGNVSADASLLSIPSGAVGQLDTLMDSDWFEVSLSAGTTYDFSVFQGTAGSAQLALYTMAGTQLLSDSGPASGGILAELSYTPSIADTFFLRVNSTGDVGTYALSVQEADDHGDTIAESTGPVVMFALGGIQNNGDVDAFNFNVTAGMQYDIKVIDLGIPDATLTLLDSGGGVVDSDSGANPGGTHAQLTWVAQSDGVMYFTVEADYGSFGDYGVTISASEPTLVGDLDGDGFVGLSDLDVVLGNWNLSVPPADASADPSGDGFVGLDDLDIVLGNWNAGTPPAVAAIATSQPAASMQAVSAPLTSSASDEVNASALQRLALINWHEQSRSAFGLHDTCDDQPAIGLWE